MFSRKLAETHSAGFELRRHFFRRFFDNDLIADAGQAKVFAGGVLAIVISLGFLYAQAYYSKYRHLDSLPGAGPYTRAAMADFLFLITLVMTMVALFTTIQWPSLFPGLRDYLALAGLPVRMRDIFVAKFTGLLAYSSMAIVGTTALPSFLFPAVMKGDYGPHMVLQIPGIFLSGSLAGFFVFFSMVTLQGVLLNVLPVRQFHRVSLTVQGLLLGVLLCTLPLVFSIPDLHSYMDLRPAWALWVPPLWFLGVDQMIAGDSGALAQRLAEIALGSVVLAAVLAILTYLWSYRRHRTRVLESPGALDSTGGYAWVARFEDSLIPDPRSLAVFGFIGKSLARSRQHRLILTGFAAVALAVICEGFFSLLLQGGTWRHVSLQAPAFRQAAMAVPLALSLFMLAGLRYLFRLPVELRANWVFRVHEPGNASALLGGAENFLLYLGVFPVALLTMPGEVALLGLRSGVLTSLLCLFASLTLMELLLFSMERIPFTSSYFPGKEPPIVSVIKYALASSLYVGVLSSVIRWAGSGAIPAVLLLFLFACAWLRARTARLNIRQIARLEFEEIAEPAVQLLMIERD